MRRLVRHISMISTAAAPMSRFHVRSKSGERVPGQRERPLQWAPTSFLDVRECSACGSTSVSAVGFGCISSRPGPRCIGAGCPWYRSGAELPAVVCMESVWLIRDLATVGYPPGLPLVEGAESGKSLQVGYGRLVRECSATL